MIQDDALSARIDGLSERLNRTVTVVDPDGNVLAYNTGTTVGDEMRLNTILRRSTPPVMHRWVMSLGIRTAHQPVRVPGNEELRSLPRLCCPLRSGRRLLGFMWIIDRDEDLSDEEMKLATATVDAVVELLVSREQAERERQAESARLVLALVSASDDVRMSTIDRIDRSCGFDLEKRLQVFVVGTHHDELAPSRVLHVTDWLDGIAGMVPRRLLYAETAGQVVFVLAHRLHDDLREIVDAVMTSAPSVVNPPTLHIGVSSVVSAIDGHRALREAQQCCRIAKAVERFGGVAFWDDAGVYRQLAAITQQVDLSEVPTLLDVLDEHDAVLSETLETFLDCAGDVAATCQTLFIHRTSLYYRLRRIESLLGVSLKDGDVRLRAHLEVKLRRFAGSAAKQASWAAGGVPDEERRATS